MSYGCGLKCAESRLGWAKGIGAWHIATDARIIEHTYWTISWSVVGVKLREALQAVKNRGVELEAKLEALTAAHGELDHERAETEHAQKEAHELWLKVDSLEQEHNELISWLAPVEVKQD